MLLPFNTHKDKAMMGGTWIVHSEKLSSDAGFLLFYAVSLLQILLERNHYFSIDKQRIARSFWQHCVPYTFSKREEKIFIISLYYEWDLLAELFATFLKKVSIFFFFLWAFNCLCYGTENHFYLLRFSWRCILTTLWN